MTDQPKPERGSEQPSEELPIPKLETPSQASPSAVDTDAIVKQVAEQLRRELRQAQSTKDKEINAIKKTLGISDLSELEEMGAQIPENVKLEYRLRQLEGRGQEPTSSPSQQAPSPGNGAVLTAQDVSEVVKRFNLDANDTEVIEKLRGTYRNRDHFEATLAQVALARVNRPQPSPTGAPSMPASPAPSATDEGEMIQKMAELQADPVRNRKAIQELQAKLKW